MHKQKGFAPILIILSIVLLLGVAGGVYYFGKSQTPKPQTPQPTITPSPTPDASHAPTGAGETANWKIYNNQKYQFTFKYPTNWQLIEKGDSGAITVSLYPPDVDLQKLSPDDPQIGVQILTSPIPSGNLSQQGIDFITDWKRVTINGIMGFSYKTHQCAPQCTATVDFPIKDDQRLKVYMTTVAEEKGYVDIYNQILSTFKFIN